jgi:hypothetical protein
LCGTTSVRWVDEPLAEKHRRRLTVSELLVEGCHREVVAEDEQMDLPDSGVMELALGGLPAALTPRHLPLGEARIVRSDDAREVGRKRH